MPETPDTVTGAAEPAGAADPAEPAAGPPDAPRRRRTNHLRTLVDRLSPVGPPAGRWFAGVVAAVVTAVSTAWLLSGLIPTTPPPPPPSPGLDGLPFTVAVRTGHDPTAGWVVDAPLADTPARPPWSDDWSSWAREAAGVPAARSEAYFTVQGALT